MAVVVEVTVVVVVSVWVDVAVMVGVNVSHTGVTVLVAVTVAPGTVAVVCIIVSSMSCEFTWTNLGSRPYCDSLGLHIKLAGCLDDVACKDCKRSRNTSE